MSTDNQHHNRNEKITAMLDVRKLALQCEQLEKEVETEKQRNQIQTETINRLKDESKNLSRYADLGRCEVEKQKQESLTRLRAIVHYSGDRERLQTMERSFADNSFPLSEIARLHRQITNEFRSLYPTKPLSRFQEDASASSGRIGDLADYRIGAAD